MAEKKQPEQETAYGKQQLIESNKYSRKRDLITALLEDGKSYTFSQVDAIVDKFLKGKVK